MDKKDREFIVKVSKQAKDSKIVADQALELARENSSALKGIDVTLEGMSKQLQIMIDTELGQIVEGAKTRLGTPFLELELPTGLTAVQQKAVHAEILESFDKLVHKHGIKMLKLNYGNTN